MTEHPKVVQTLRAVLVGDFDDDLQAERIVIHALQSGEVTYRIYRPGIEEPLGGITSVE